MEVVMRGLHVLREMMGDDIDIGIDFHAKPGPTVASVMCKEVESLNLMFVEEPCPPENVKAMKRITDRTTVPIATGERLITPYACRELIEPLSMNLHDSHSDICIAAATALSGIDDPSVAERIRDLRTRLADPRDLEVIDELLSDLNV